MRTILLAAIWLVGACSDRSQHEALPQLETHDARSVVDTLDEVETAVLEPEPPPIPVLRQILRSNPEDTTAQRQLALRLYWQERHEESLRAFRRLTEIAPNATFGWYGRARGSFEAGLYEESVVAFERLLELDPTVFDNPFASADRQMWETALVRTGRRPPRQ